MLASARDHYRRQQRVSAAGLAAARRAYRRGDRPGLVRAVALYQAAAAQESAGSVALMLAEQGIDAEPVGRVNPLAFAGVASDGRPLASLLEMARDEARLSLMVLTQFQDAGRVASGVAITARPAVQGHVRYLNAPSCPRCAILAGRWYRWSSDFQRHPRCCDCRMVPTNQEPARGLVGDPMRAFRAGQVEGLSAADTEAIRDGADISQVVNVRRAEAGLSAAGGRVLGRDGRPTPEGIYRIASDRAEAIALLERFRYIVT